jgi:hypothetical protein
MKTERGMETIAADIFDELAVFFRKTEMTKNLEILTIFRFFPELKMGKSLLSILLSNHKESLMRFLESENGSWHLVFQT